MGPLESAETANAADLRVPGRGEVLPAVGHARTVVQKDSDVDAHDGDDAAAVEIHHEESLEGEGRDLVVHHLDEAEGEHEEDKQLAVHTGESDPQLGEALASVP